MRVRSPQSEQLWIQSTAFDDVTSFLVEGGWNGWLRRRKARGPGFVDVNMTNHRSDSVASKLIGT